MGQSYLLENDGLYLELNLGATIQKRFGIMNHGGLYAVFEQCTEFVLYIKEGRSQRILSDRDCHLRDVRSWEDGLELTYTHEGYGLAMTVIYDNDGETVHKRSKLTVDRPLTVTQYVAECVHWENTVSGGGEGQPVFVGDCLFTGLEYPTARNEYADDCIFFQQYPYVTLEAGQCFDFPPVVYGFRGSGSVAETFMQYIWKSSPVRYKIAPSIYNEWAAHDELGSGPELDETLVMGQLDRLECLKEKTGFVFDYYTMDAFWFEENSPYLRFKARTWPSGPDHVCARIRDLGMKFGLWFDVNGEMLKLTDAKCHNRFRCEYKKCLADPGYLQILQEGILYNVIKYDLHMIKLDFADFDCEDPAHEYHGPTRRTSKDAAVRGLIEVLGNVRKVRPDIMIMAYNGFTTSLDWLVAVDRNRQGRAVSPWWSFYLEYIYCGDPRPSEFPARSLRHSVDWYIDGMVRTFYESLMPLPCIDDCGVMVGNADTIYQLGKADWRDGWMLSLSRGGKKLHFYGNLELLDDSDFEFIEASCPMFEKLRINDGTVQTRCILGDARLGQPYGYSNEAGFEGWLTVVNPTGREHMVTLSLPVWQAGGQFRIRTFYEASEIIDGPWHNVGASITVALKSEAVMVFYWELCPPPVSASGIISVLPHSNAHLTLSGNVGSHMAVKFIGENGEPLRTYTLLPDGFSISGDVGPSVITQKIWSGLSWNMYRMHGNRNIVFENSSDTEIRLLWKVCETGGIL